MESIHWAMALSFILGACGYIIIRYWIIPIMRYKKNKADLKQHLQTCIRGLPEGAEGKSMKKALEKKSLQEIRRLGMKLVEIHDVDLPYWYRLVLMTRKESPLNAREPILKLENMQSAHQAKQCVADISRHLRIQIL